MAVAFSSNDIDVIHRKIKTDLWSEKTLTGNELEDFYELTRCADWIKANKFTKVALQFPDDFLKDSAAVALWLQQHTTSHLYILGDTSYGSCCVDEIAAEHVSADGIIHFGHTCLSPCNRLPVLYVFGKFPLDVDNAVNEFKNLFPNVESLFIILYEVFYVHAIDKFTNCLKLDYDNIVLSELILPDEKHMESALVDETDMTKCKRNSTVVKCGRLFKIPQDHSFSDYNMFYIGSQNRTLSNFMVSFSTSKFYSYDPFKRIGRQETLDINKYLRKRYYYIEKAKDAKIIGILVGTLGVRNYLEIINHLKLIIKEAGKKSYTLVVGKLNCAKLANFSEIEIFVCVACPESSIVDSHEFYQPIITPYELEIACNEARTWTGDYITDFSKLLPGASSYVPLVARTCDEGDVSLLTGKIRSCALNSENSNDNFSNSSITTRDEMKLANIHIDAAGEYLANRSFKGLEQHLGETPAAEIIQGKAGIACEYEDEGKI